MLEFTAHALKQGKPVTITAHGNSMSPHIKDGDKVTIDPNLRPVPGAIVLAKVRGRYYLHFCVAVKNGMYQIGNANNHINGWTKSVFGVVVR